jgi:aminoglycoside phosphotransferase (APT) family kinase protein
VLSITVAQRHSGADNRAMAEHADAATLLRPPEKAVPQDWNAVARYLRTFGHDLGGESRQFAGGFGNLNYLIEIDGRPAVLRRPPDGPLPAGANDMAREYRILSRLWRAYPLAPRALMFCEDPVVLGAPFLILEHRPGIIVREALPPLARGSAKTGADLSSRLVESLVALHSVDPAQVGLETLGSPAGFFGRTLAGWERRGAAVADLFDPRTFAETVAWLRRRVPPDRSPTLLHNDFKLDNVILDPLSLRPVAVIDWDMGTRGDPFWDLAVLLSYWVEPQDPPIMHRLQQMPTIGHGFWRRAEVVSAYCRASGRASEDFTVYRVLALLRSAVVFAQLFDRWRRDPAANAGCARFDGFGRELMDYAITVASGEIE